MKSFFLPLISTSLLWGANHYTSEQCESCHPKIVQEWKTSSHAKAHFHNNILFDKTLKIASQKSGIPLEQLQTNCMTCHSPFVSTSQDLVTSLAKEGVGCSSCHNVAEIRSHSSKPSVGKNVLLYGKEDVMYGPHNDARSPFHKTALNPIVGTKSNTLCLSCHNVHKNPQGVQTCSTGIEYAKSATDKSCVSCHMGEGKRQESALGGKQRLVKSHIFKGALNSDILNESVTMTLVKNDKNLSVIVENLLPHNFPTGFPGRQVFIDVSFNGNQINRFPLTFTLLDQENKPTIGVLSVKEGDDSRLKPYEKRVYSVVIPQGSTKANVKISYRRIPMALAEKLLIDELKNDIVVMTKELSF